MFLGLQVLRFLAATSITLYHAIHYALTMEIVPSGWIDHSPTILSSGVTVFFALSGFLMAKMAEDSTPLRFLSRRLLRIYPPFLTAIGITVGSKLLIWGSAPQFDSVVVLSLFPPGGPIPYPLGVEWSLVYEVFFYLVVSGLCTLPTTMARQAFIAAWTIAIVVANELFTRSVTTMLPGPGQISFSYINLAFIAGMCGWWLRARAEGFCVPLLVAGLIAIATAHTISADQHWLARHLISVLGATLLVVSASTLQATGWVSRRSPLVMLGDGSYGIYLLHVPIITIIFAICATKGFVIVLAGIAAAIVFGAAYGVMEFNLYRKVIYRIEMRPLTTATAAAEQSG